ncbi:DnaJ domain protein [Aspergillus saccharolyticus JOP 1030-1]|uniref:J domain-containing protein n=1 Tax=Aspergillus saccharolyticus JOP 1030-1 TaxID=1450539 RepID=A0A318ZH77_9EURO|nr:hypothetical protein BP01DRAFT_37263 [Aspergillus saccharolyticus JOP 1030-1]PYH45704.1 hypothetical protein BP01DRAFT_37263 [Aspergillus saccharolyticus JOP 1030-1]
MVKADVRRDYYADLGLTPSAETEDIKRQFRKLALKYHPDRNPGREVDFIAKFQAIQAAHEILIDPQQRLRYDTDRLRAGYGKFYGPSKTSQPRKTAATPQPSTYSPKPPPTKPQPSTRPQSYHAGPSSGAQRYASYARAAPKQPWEKAHDEGQTRADAYRGFQDMKGNGMPGGWSSFDPRTGRAGYNGATPRPTKANGQSPRPKSAFEYFRTSNKQESPEAARTQTKKKKKQGFAPHVAGGDEPMATHTSSYTSRNERAQTPNAYFGAAPSPTAKKSAPNRTDTPEFERMRRGYASTGGEKTFFGSANIGRSASTRDSTESPKPRSRTNPSSPTPPAGGRCRSASPNYKDKSTNYSFTSSSSELDEEDEEDFLARKPKATPKSRLHPHKRFTAFHTEQNSETVFGSSGNDATSAKNPFDTSNIFSFTSPLDSKQDPEQSGVPPSGSFKSSSHEHLRNTFSAENWNGAAFFDSTAPNLDGRGRTATRDASERNGHSVDTSDHAESVPEPDPQPTTTFAQYGFPADQWTEMFKNMSFEPEKGKTQQTQTASSQRQTSPRKQRTATKTRPIPKPATVTTEADETQTTSEGNNIPESAKNGDAGVEAMDLDDTPPPAAAGKADGTTKTEKAVPVAKPALNEGRREETAKNFNLEDLSKTVPLTQNTNGGIEDLQDIKFTLPFESRPEYPKATMRSRRPRDLVLPQPPKRPTAPEPIPLIAGSEQLVLSRAAFDRYTAEMAMYMSEFHAWNRRMLRHFDARQEAIDTGMAPNWIYAVGDAAKVKLNPEDEQDGPVAGSGKGGYNAYRLAMEQDERVEKHWQVGRELHRDAIYKLGELRDWVAGGGKMV